MTVPVSTSHCCIRLSSLTKQAFCWFSSSHSCFSIRICIAFISKHLEVVAFDTDTCLWNIKNFIHVPYVSPRYHLPAGFTGPVCEFGQDTTSEITTGKARIVNSQVDPISSIMLPKSGICEEAGCLFHTRYADRVCRADCVLKGCLGLDAMRDCPYWQACLAASTSQSATSIQESCLGKFRNGQCDSMCNVPECNHDGLDCWETR